MTKRENLDQITESMIGAAIEVHRALGPGLLESAYEACLTFGPTRPEGGTTETSARGLSGGQAGLWLPPGSSRRRSGHCRGDAGSSGSIAFLPEAFWLQGGLADQLQCQGTA